MRNNISESRWENLIKIQTRIDGENPLMSAVHNQSNLNRQTIELLIPSDYRSNYNFWRTIGSSLNHSPTLLHLAFDNSLPNVWDRINLLHQFIPEIVWEELLLTNNSYHQTPLMVAMWLSPEINEEIISLLIPKNKLLHLFWRQTVNNREHRTKGCNILHLSIMNSQNNLLNCLRYLRTQMGEEIWEQLLYMNNEMPLQETVIEMARRLKKPDQVVNELLRIVIE